MHNKMISQYEDGSNSWMVNHFTGFSPELALKVRKFLTPSPVLMLKKGDLRLHIEESVGPDYDKLLVFRKRNV